jgi:hypothetical protein
MRTVQITDRESVVGLTSWGILVFIKGESQPVVGVGHVKKASNDEGVVKECSGYASLAWP